MQNLLVNSHYKMPWIVWKREYSITVNQYDYIPDQLLAHGLPFTPLLIGQWSDNANFTPSYDLGVTIPGGSTGGQPETVVSTNADATNVHFTVINNSTTRTFYFRLMALAPPNYTGEVTPVPYNGALRFNSHYRYQQIHMAGRATGGTVTHGLGYLPQAQVWTDSGGRVGPFGGILTNQTLACMAENTPFYYYIYKDRLDG